MNHEKEVNTSFIIFVLIPCRKGNIWDIMSQQNTLLKYITPVSPYCLKKKNVANMKPAMICMAHVVFPVVDNVAPDPASSRWGPQGLTSHTLPGL